MITDIINSLESILHYIAWNHLNFHISFCFGTKWKQIIREGDPVQRVVFIVRGRVKSSQNLSKGVVATSILEPGGFLGDELLSWCLRRPFIDRLPASSATFTCIDSTEAFGLDANHLRFITDHFRYKFANERLKRTARYYSANWRTWAAVNVQLAWRRYVVRTRGSRPVAVPENGDDGDRRLRQYAAMFLSIRPHDHLEWYIILFVFLICDFRFAKVYIGVLGSLWYCLMAIKGTR